MIGCDEGRLYMKVRGEERRGGSGGQSSEGPEKISDSQNNDDDDDDDESSEVPMSQITQKLQFFPLYYNYRHSPSNEKE